MRAFCPSLRIVQLLLALVFDAWQPYAICPMWCPVALLLLQEAGISGRKPRGDFLECGAVFAPRKSGLPPALCVSCRCRLPLFPFPATDTIRDGEGKLEGVGPAAAIAGTGERVGEAGAKLRTTPDDVIVAAADELRCTIAIVA